MPPVIDLTDNPGRLATPPAPGDAERHRPVRPPVVLDPCVLIAAAIAPRGACSRLLSAWEAGELELVVSPHLLWELKVVLERRKFRKYLSREQVGRFVALLRQRARLVADPRRQRGLTLDPGDDYLVTLARTARAAFLVSADHHLRDVPGLVPPVLSPQELLDRLGAWRRGVPGTARRFPVPSGPARKPALLSTGILRPGPLLHGDRGRE
jgi:putative PIN family toxin of toxin-antitoxin system